MNRNRIFRPIAWVFVLLNGFILLFRSFLETHGFNFYILFYANLLLFFVTLIGFLLQRRGLASSNPNAFVRAVYGSVILKMFICMIAVLLYVFVFRNSINKPALFAGMGMYVIYTTVEVAVLMKAARKRNG